MKIFVSVLVSSLLVFSPSIAGAKQQTKIEYLHQQGLSLLNQWKFREAIPVYLEIISLDPEDKTAQRYLEMAKEQTAEPLCQKAASAYLDKNYKKAISLWEDILKENPNDQRAVKLIAMTKSIIVANSLESQYVLADRLIKDKKYSAAIVELEKLISANPNDSRALEMRKTAKQGVVEEQIRQHYEQGEEYAKAERYDLAIEEWRRVLDLDSKQESALRFIAEVGRKKLAAEYDQAKQLYETGNYSASRDAYTRIVTENPTDRDTAKLISKLDGIVAVSERIDDQGTAWEMIRKAISNYISNSGNIKAAIAAARYAEQLEPESDRIRGVREFIEKENFSIVRSMAPPSKNESIIDQYLSAALDHIYEGRFDLAIQECDIVLILQPQNVLALKRLGSAYYATGKRSKAKEIWTKALQLSPEDQELKQFIRKAG